MTFTVTKYGNPVLRKKAEPIAEVTDEIRKLADDMLETMYAEHGLGLAAEQIGKSAAICVIDVPADADVDANGDRENPDVEMPLVLINPKITEESDMIVTSQEGCLSFPGIYSNVGRFEEVTVKFQDRNATWVELRVKGLLARAVQHELDHLDGVLLADRMSPVKKVALSGKLKKLAKQTKRELQKL
ncbi:peptide deformylase [Verrucomicrobiota bacterium]